MAQCFYIYLAGTIKKGKEEEAEEAWTQEEMQTLQSYLSPLELIFLNPATRSDDLSDQKSVFGRDLFQVSSSQLILVDARGKRGLGVGAEMMYAKMQRIPVVSWLPKDSHYHRRHFHFLGQDIKEWVHPFVFSLSDYLAPDLKQAAQWIENDLLKGKSSIKGPEVIQDSIQHYLSTQLERDEEMYNIVRSHPHFLSHR